MGLQVAAAATSSKKIIQLAHKWIIRNAHPDFLCKQAITVYVYVYMGVVQMV